MNDFFCLSKSVRPDILIERRIKKTQMQDIARHCSQQEMFLFSEGVKSKGLDPRKCCSACQSSYNIKKMIE